MGMGLGGGAPRILERLLIGEFCAQASNHIQMPCHVRNQLEGVR